MNDRMELYRDILRQEPGSRLFLGLARLLAEAHRNTEAAAVLEKGLEWHPDFLEARLLLVSLLRGLGREEAAREHVRRIAAVFDTCPEFWNCWSEAVDSPDLALTLRMLGTLLQNPGRGVGSILELGLDALAGKAAPEKVQERVPSVPARPLPAEPRDVTEEDGEAVETMPSFRTRSMAMILAEQGDIVGALDIYRELLQRAADEGERQELQECIDRLENRPGGGESPRSSANAEKSGEKASLFGVLDPGTVREEIPRKPVRTWAAGGNAGGWQFNRAAVPGVGPFESRASEAGPSKAEYPGKRAGAAGIAELDECVPISARIENILELLAERLEARARG